MTSLYERLAGLNAIVGTLALAIGLIAVPQTAKAAFPTPSGGCTSSCAVTGVYPLGGCSGDCTKDTNGTNYSCNGCTPSSGLVKDEKGNTVRVATCECTLVSYDA